MTRSRFAADKCAFNAVAAYQFSFPRKRTNVAAVDKKRTWTGGIVIKRCERLNRSNALKSACQLLSGDRFILAGHRNQAGGSIGSQFRC